MTLKRCFYHLGDSWYAEENLRTTKYVDDITFGLYSTDGGTTGEMAVQWYNLRGNKLTPKLEVFNDSFHLISAFSDVMDALSKMKEFTPHEFVELLKELGFEDKTQREEPKTFYEF